jgi:hypothetical protein
MVVNRALCARRLVSTYVFVLTTLGLSASASAEEANSTRRAAVAVDQNYTHTLISVNLGLLSLPAADVCPRSRTSCEKGETSVSFGVYNQYRFGKFGLGASVNWAASLVAGVAPGVPELEREHDRSYFLVEGQARYYGIRAGRWEWWGGVTLGGVVIKDAWSVISDREPYAGIAFVGPKSAMISTEGLAAGLAIGGEWNVTQNWYFGTTLRYAKWLLPTTARQAPTTDSASLSGNVDVLDFGLLVAYRIAL